MDNTDKLLYGKLKLVVWGTVGIILILLMLQVAVIKYKQSLLPNEPQKSVYDDLVFEEVPESTPAPTTPNPEPKEIRPKNNEGAYVFTEDEIEAGFKQAGSNPQATTAFEATVTTGNIRLASTPGSPIPVTINITTTLDQKAFFVSDSSLSMPGLPDEVKKSLENAVLQQMVKHLQASIGKAGQVEKIIIGTQTVAIFLKE